jgi:competence ComEA-like helix-hairpin-helix protein
MALFSFGKKDKNPPEASAPVAKTQPNPPKIQNPPVTGSFPAVKPPQPTGLMPATMKPGGTATTQPLSTPRTGSTGLKPARPGIAQSTRPTQRIVLPSSGPNSTKSLSSSAVTGRIQLPIGMILRCLPPEVLSADLSEFEASGAAATEIGLPMNMILGQLPSGKVEMALQDLVPHFPAGYLQPTESIASYLPTLVSLPLMDVVMRIPPDLLAIRPDQKDVDAAVINMADPFTEEILREQAETRRRAQSNIIEESQAPHEEFVPRDQVGGPKTVAPPRRPASEPMIPTRTVSAASLAASPTPLARPPISPVASTPGSLRASAAIPPVGPSPASRPVPSSGSIPVLTRTTTPLPARSQGAATVPIDATPASQSSAPVPPVPRHTGPIPAPPPPRHTTSLPTPRRTGALPVPPRPEGSAAVEIPAAPAAEGQADPGADDLQRLAALAMAQLGDVTEATTGSGSSEALVSGTSEADAGTEPHAGTEPASPSEGHSPDVSEDQADASVALNLNTCTVEDLVHIPGCFPDLAHSIIDYRTKIGSFKRLEDLLDVPGITKAAYTNLTGEIPPANRIPLSLNELLGFPPEQHIALKDVTDRIACWPDITGCVLSQSSGLSLVGSVPEGLDKAAIVAFAPRMFEAINKSFSEISGKETDTLVIPSPGTSFHIFRNKDLYLIILSRLPQMPERHMRVANFVLAALGIRRD